MSDPVPSLSQLQDIVLPAPPPWWPPTPELVMLLLLLAATLLVVWLQWRRARLRDAYRAEGLELLRGASTVYEVSVILKRVALAAFPRDQVASLYGAEWAEFLQRTGGGDFGALVRSEPASAAAPELVERAAGWIKRHRAIGPGVA